MASLPVRLGGFGASDPVTIHPQAAVASFLSAASGQAGLPLSRLNPDLRAAVDTLYKVLPLMAAQLHEQWLTGDLANLLANPDAGLWMGQKTWTMAVHEALAKSFDGNATDRLERCLAV